MVKLALQALALKQRYPDASIRLSARALFWRGLLKPSVNARGYDVVLIAQSGDLVPHVYVSHPALEPDDEGNVPHVYRDGSLCLSRGKDLGRSALYADTVVPWSSEWLFYYELWKATGIWMGDEIDADRESTKSVLHPYPSGDGPISPEVNIRQKNAGSDRGEKQ